MIESTNAQEQYNLDNLYDKGQGVPQDYAKAAIWYRKSADQENASAQNNLEILYDQGLDAEQSYAQAAK